MEERELIEIVQKFLEKGIEDDEIEKYESLKLNKNAQGNPYRKIVGIGSLEGLELVEHSRGRIISRLKLSRDQELYINPSNYTHPFKENSAITIAIKNCELGWLDFPQCEGPNYKNFNVLIEETEVYNLVLKGTNVNKVTLTDCCLHMITTFYEILLQEIELKDCFGNIDFGILEQNGGKVESMKISILGGEYDSISIRNHETTPIELKDVNCKTPIIIDVSIKGEKERLQFDSLIISGNTSEVRVNKYDINHLSIKDIVHQGNSTFKDIGVKKLTIDSAINLGKITFLNLIPLNHTPSNYQKLNDTQSYLEISNSTLGNTYFINSQLYNFSKTNIQDVDLSGVRSINTKWPGNINEEDPNQRREAFRQLKLLMANSQDKINELEFYRNEMDAYYDQVIEDKEASFWKKFNLWISKYSNHFGDNYVKPISLYLKSSVILYLSILLLTYYKEYYKEIGLAFIYPLTHQGEFLDFDWQKLNHYLVKYVEFLNPTHSINFIEGISFASATIDFFSKIIFGFLIYQTITAFRKLYRK